MGYVWNLREELYTRLVFTSYLVFLIGMETNGCAIEAGWKQMDVPSNLRLQEENQSIQLWNEHSFIFSQEMQLSLHVFVVWAL